MTDVFQELSFESQRRYTGIRRKIQFFTTFAGGVVEALRELGYRLSTFEKQSPVRRFAPQPQAGALATSSGGSNIELYFEQRDNDQCRVLIVPYRTDLAYLARDRYTAQLGIELSRYSNDPDVLRQAMNANTRGQVGTFLGGVRGHQLPKLYLDSPPDLKQPGSMTFELRGARLVVAMNVLTDLGKYRLSDFDLDIPSIKADLQAYFYGLEKYLSLLLQNFGSDIVMENAQSAGEEQTSPPSSVAEETSPRNAPMASEGSPSKSHTVPLSQFDAPGAHTVDLSRFTEPPIDPDPPNTIPLTDLRSPFEE